jgi:pyrroloquinoline quinone biosynthesis protein B
LANTATAAHFHGVSIAVGRNWIAGIALLVLAVTASGCKGEGTTKDPAAFATSSVPPTDRPFIVVVGEAQDGGFPQAGTRPGDSWDPARRRFATSLGIVDPVSRERWMIEATPDFRDQLHLLDLVAPSDSIPGLAGILVTHAHIGHYTGLMHLGLEAIGARGVPVYAMPRMREFLSSEGPWDQLVRYGNISLMGLEDGRSVQLNARISVTPFLVPHRDEYSETVGYRITGPGRTVVFIPDIDKWERWDSLGTRIEDVVAGADVALLDGTFFQDGEVPGRPMSEIPHPFVSETMRRFSADAVSSKAKLRFIHLNRTNPLLDSGSEESRQVIGAGFGIARQGDIIPLG